MKIDLKNIQISQKDKRALALAVIVCFAIAAYLLVEPMILKWKTTQADFKNNIEDIQKLTSSSGLAKFKGLISVVPAFELPVEKQQQVLKFSNKFNEQLKQAGIKPTTMQLDGIDKKGNKLIKLHCKADCNVDQIFSLLGDLDQNPYYSHIEEFKMKLDSKNRNKATMTMTILTYIH